MTVQYEGNGLYNLMIGTRSVVLHESELQEIQDFNFDTMKSDNYIESLKENFDKLQDYVEDTEWEIGILVDKINDGEIESIDKIAEELAKLTKIA